MSSADSQTVAETEPVTSLLQVDRELIFRQATSGLVHHYGDQFADGMSDGELWKALQETLGIFGGSGGPDRSSVTYRGAGLKIWGAWEVINHVTTAPLFSGQATVDMARGVYGIRDPTQDQLSLL